MSDTRIGLMSFTVRKFMKTDKQIPQTLERLKALGINALELAYIKWSPNEIDIIDKACKGLNMDVLSSQIKYKTIIEKYDLLVKMHHQMGTKRIAVSVLPMAYVIKGEKGIREFAVRLNQLGKRLKSDGITLLYHHHHMEFVRYGDQTGLELLMALTEPEYVGLELDVFWAQKGGKNPAALIEQFASRIQVIHLRDYQLKLSLRHRDFLAGNCSLGKGNLDIDGIIKQAKALNIPFLAIEEDTKTPFESIELSIAHLKRFGQIL